MSAAYYSELWLVTQNDLQQLLELDEKRMHELMLSESKDETLNKILPLYVKYCSIVRRLTMCHDQIIQIQKRNLIRKTLDCAIGRMLEYKREIVNLVFTDYVWPDRFMVEMKLTPDDIALTTPVYYTADRKVLLQEREKYVEDLIANARKQNDDGIRSSSNSDNFSMKFKTGEETPLVDSTRDISIQIRTEATTKEAKVTKEEEFKNAILLIQSHERARQARCKAMEAERRRLCEEKLMTGEMVPKQVGSEERAKAATAIQKVWRGYQTRKSIVQRTNQVEELLGMTMPNKTSGGILEKDVVNFERRLGLQTLAAKRKEEASNDERNRLVETRVPGLIEDITDEIRNWFIDWYNELGYFDVYPTPEAGGSVLIATGQTLTPQEFLLNQSGKDKGGKEKNKSGRKKNVDKEKLADSKALAGLREANEEFVRDWSLRDESGNPQENEYRDLITDELCHELQLETRKVVDESMRLELEKLNAALKKDYAASKGKMNIPKPTKAKRPKGQKKRKAKKDQLADYAAEDLFEELVLANVIKNYPRVRLRDWIGDLSYQNYEAQHELREHHHRLGEIRQLVMEYCVLPLGSKQAHQIAPLVRSVNICGLPESGQQFLAHAICTEVGATLFDLTPEVLADKYVGKKEQRQFIDTVAKLSRIYAPSVIFIDGGEKPWLKKVPADLQFAQPKRFASLLPKLVKGVKPGDQVLFLTTSSEPYNATNKFIKIHDKFIVIPTTDYNTLYMFYKTLLTKYYNLDRNLDVSCLARLSVGLPLEFIRETIEKIMTTERRITLKFKPLRQREIMERLLEYDKLDAKSIEQFKKFVNRLPLERKRAKMIATEKHRQTENLEAKKQK